MKNTQDELLNQIIICLGEDDNKVKEIKDCMHNKKARKAFIIIKELRDKNMIYGDNIDELIEKYWWDYAN